MCVCFFPQFLNHMHPPFLLAENRSCFTPQGHSRLVCTDCSVRWLRGYAHTSEHLGAHSCGEEIAPQWNASLCSDFARAEGQLTT